ncbi:MAG: helix-turn-helix transcriptional regulator, partial [Flavobacteriaceae bacterium]
DLTEVEGELFCGHNEGTFLVKNNTLKTISSYTGGWVVKKVPESQNTYVQGTYAGLVKFYKKENQWQSKHLGKTTMPIKYLVFQDKNTAWAAHAYKGLYKINFSNNTDSVISIINYVNKGLDADYNIRVYKIKSDICFKTNSGWKRYEPLLDSIIPHNYLNDIAGSDSYIISGDDLEFLAFKSKTDVIKFKSFKSEAQDFLLSQDLFENRLIVGDEKVSNISGTLYALNLNNGFMYINTNANSDTDSLKQPNIDKIITDKGLVNLNNLTDLEIGFNERATIYMSSPKSNKHFFEYAIKNYNANQWNKIDRNKLELSNLKDGSYTINLRTKNASGETSSVKQLNLKILPPWYRGVVGALLYVFLIMLLMVGAYYLHKLNVKKQQRSLHLQLLKQQREVIREKTIENEKRIIQLKNESLKNEVKLKSKQLANTAMALVKKNEAIQDIKKEIVEHKKGFENTYSYKKILKKLDSSISQDDEWELFEYNFNQVHEEFFNKLKNQFSDLTHKDLKLCAYIKMNLSTKEIAPLMNISIRGVETHRYRLKRKLKLENDNSLSEFLRNVV